MAGKIFINYRRKLNLMEARLLKKVLERHFGAGRMFLDESGLEGGGPASAEAASRVQRTRMSLTMSKHEPPEIASGAFFHGSSWNGDPRSLRTAQRFWGTPGFRLGVTGFRVARTLD